MSALQLRLIQLIEILPQEKLQSALDYMEFLSTKTTPLDAYDYALAKKADLPDHIADETVSLRSIFEELGVRYDDV